MLYVEGQVHTLRTFIEDSKYLELYAKIMRALMSSKSRYSVLQSFVNRATYSTRAGPLLVDVQAKQWQEVEAERHACARVAYLVPRLFSFRNFPYILSLKLRKYNGRQKA